MKIEHKVYTTYSSESDITFIMLDTYIGNNCISTEVKGFYYGKEDKESTKQYYGKLKAEF